MAFYYGYDTDDLTQRQYHYFCKLNKGNKPGVVRMVALNFLEYSVRKNHVQGEFDNYNGDCEWLFNHTKQCEEADIELDKVYT